MVEQLARAFAAGRVAMRGHEAGELGRILRVGRFEPDQLGVQASLGRAVGVEDVRDPSGHAGSEVSSDRAENYDPARGHVLAAMVPHALHHRCRSAVADRKARAGAAGEEEAPAGAIAICPPEMPLPTWSLASPRR